MKKIFTPLALVSLIVFFQSCSKPGPTAAETVTSQLTGGTWKLKTLTVDAVDQTSLFQNMTLTFTSTDYTSTKGGAVWSSNGTWKFTDATATSFTRNDGLVVKIQKISTSSLTLDLTWATTTLGAGRVESMKGDNVYVFQR